MSSQMVVCNVYKLLKDGKSFTKRGMELKRSEIALSRDWVERHNSQWGKCGLWHEILEEETEKFYELKEQARLDRKKKSEIKSRMNDALTSIVESSNHVAEEEFDEMEALRAEYEEKTGKKLSARFKNDAEWIKSKLEEHGNQ